MFQILDRQVGPGCPTYVVAELSANHHQSLDTALQLVRAAAEAGADAVKLQTYTADTLTLNSHSAPFQIHGTIWEGRTLYDLYQQAYTPWEWTSPLMQAAQDLGMACFSSPFDASAVDFLEGLSVPAYKIASFELVDLPLIEKVARTGKPLIMSTGMADLGEIDAALRAARGAGGESLCLLKCTSAYPTPPSAMNLRTIPHMADTFGVPVGLSDHSPGHAAAVAAVALGACLVEKHLTLDRSQPGPDSAFSLEPGEFKTLVDSVRIAEQALGRVRYQPTESEMQSRIFRRSLFVTRAVKAGEPVSEENVRSVRPAHGMSPMYLPNVLGRRFRCDLDFATPLGWNHLE